MAIAALIIEGELLLTELTALASQFHIKSDAHDILRYETAAIRAALCVLQRHQSDLETSTSESQLVDATRAQTLLAQELLVQEKAGESPSQQREAQITDSESVLLSLWGESIWHQLPDEQILVQARHFWAAFAQLQATRGY
ncbi:hypothetical protein IHE26_15765 (plasmid) [Plesiomonas shigelloides]|uniref:hypothetical protein n=1 Tax=Plesiomonas shigelloides TaxID=703 RepID=UPI001262282A|nr:hypothetical protein [Plesiomonas shigelloides]KAB7714423.1 hypothetical protein GBN32_02500 [Plesiomonas shigelloides]QOH81410.1 hypothetical protein IHE26_15765 [Plesiomonas shigelloides]